MKTTTQFESLQEMVDAISSMKRLNESFNGHMTTEELEAFIISSTDLLIVLGRNGDCVEAAHNQRSAYKNEFDLLELGISGARNIIANRRKKQTE
ncbi:hypothetical protein ACTG16_23115 [Aeromonas sp. 23P]|uniref:hypothetical protein n=1 Tax=Aeromonas sp. 23P TaxID=3452716 RepID=UPI003F7A2D44|nr:hypothetical protein [Aeromonas veronii]